MRTHTESAAAERLDPLLRLLHGTARAVEIGPRALGVRVPEHRKPERSCRVLLLPEVVPGLRVQIQPLSGADPDTLYRAAPRCFGDLGSALLGWSLDRLDLASLVLAAFAYLQSN